MYIIRGIAIVWQIWRITILLNSAFMFQGKRIRQSSFAWIVRRWAIFFPLSNLAELIVLSGAELEAIACASTLHVYGKMLIWYLYAGTPNRMSYLVKYMCRYMAVVPIGSYATVYHCNGVNRRFMSGIIHVLIAGSTDNRLFLKSNSFTFSSLTSPDSSYM